MSDDGKYAGPRLSDKGWPVGPTLYAATLRRISDALAALEAFGQHDPSTGRHTLLASGDIAVYLEDDIDDDEPPVGWLTLIDENAWVFVPYIAAIESSGVSAPTESAVAWSDGQLADVGSIHPIYLVSLDAAIEAAAKHLAEADLGLGSWVEATEEARAYWRRKLRSLITAAVMGGAQ